MVYYVEKYASEEHYQAGCMSSCKSFKSYDKAIKYFRDKGLKYKRGFVILSEMDENDKNAFPQIIEEIVCENR